MILASGSYDWIPGGPRQLWEVNGEPIIKRTIRLLLEEGVEPSDISIVTDNSAIEGYVKELSHDPKWYMLHKLNFLCPDETYGVDHWYWVDAFPITYKDATYIFGDVVFTKEAIHKIVAMDKMHDIEFFASIPPFTGNYIKRWAEPFAFRVFDNKRFFDARSLVKYNQDLGKYPRIPIAWELWYMAAYHRILNFNDGINYNDIYAINDGTCDVDSKDDYEKIKVVFES